MSKPYTIRLEPPELDLVITALDFFRQQLKGDDSTSNRPAHRTASALVQQQAGDLIDNLKSQTGT